MTTPERIARQHRVPIAVIMGNPQNGKGFDAQSEYIHALRDRGLQTQQIALFFGRSEDWVLRRVLRHKDVRDRQDMNA